MFKLKQLFFGDDEDDQRQLIEQIAVQAYQLNGIAPTNWQSISSYDLLQHVSEMLKRAMAVPGTVRERHPDPVPSEMSTNAGPTSPEIEAPPPAAPQIGASPALTDELVRLRDSVLLARDTDQRPAGQVLDDLYRRLGIVLESAGLTLLEAEEQFDDQTQLVVDTRMTLDPRQHHTVATTVRPGYRRDDHLIRPQEVIVYTYKQPTRLPQVGE